MLEDASATPPHTREWLRVGVFLATGIAGFFLLTRFDADLMYWRQVLLGGDKPDGFIRQITVSLRQIPTVLPIVVTLIVIASYDSRRKQIIPLVLSSILISQVISNAGKWTIHRDRPAAVVEELEELASLEADPSWQGWSPGIRRGSTTQSFPSGHSSAAFAFLAPLAMFYRKISWMFLGLAAGCAVSRYLDAVHWASDCFVGGMIGYASAYLMCRAFKVSTSLAN